MNNIHCNAIEFNVYITIVLVGFVLYYSILYCINYYYIKYYTIFINEYNNHLVMQIFYFNRY